MKRTNSAFFAIVIALCASPVKAQESASAERVMRRVADKLAAVKQLGYKYVFEFSQPSQDKSMMLSAVAFLDLKPREGTSQFRFRFTFGDRVDTFNGAERFYLDEKGKKLHVDANPSFKSFGNISLQNSPLSLKYALPRIIGDPSIPKKASLVRTGNREQYLIEFALYKGIVNSAGEIVEVRPDQTNKYQVGVDKSTLLPVEVVQSNDKNDETLKTSYTEMTERPAAPPPSAWYYSTYAGAYAIQQRNDLTLIESGKTAPDFSLAGFGADSRTSLAHQRGKVVLMEFWIAHCNFCISAVPKLNSLHKNYRDKGVEVISINMYDSAATIDSFKKKHKPEYTILTGGDSIAAAYGVDEYPAFVLVDGSGKIVYSSSGLEEKGLVTAILATLKQ